MIEDDLLSIISGYQYVLNTIAELEEDLLENVREEYNNISTYYPVEMDIEKPTTDLKFYALDRVEKIITMLSRIIAVNTEVRDIFISKTGGVLTSEQTDKLAAYVEALKDREASSGP